MSSSAFYLAKIASRALRELGPYTDSHHAAKVELRAAGVPDHRIDSLYPFDLADHLDSIAEMLTPAAGFREIGFLLSEAGELRDPFTVLPRAERDFGRRLVRELPVRKVLQARDALWTSHKLTSDDADFLAIKWLNLLAFFHASSKAAETQLVDFTSTLGYFAQQHRKTANKLIRYMNTIS